MKREEGHASEEPRDLSRVPGGQEHAAREEGGDEGKDWASYGTEDPAFFIKTSDEE